MIGRSWTVLFVGIVLGAQAQHTVPFVSPVQRQMAFVDGRFLEVDELPARRIWSMDQALYFEDHSGRLCYFDATERSTTVVERRTAREVMVAGDRVCWLVRDSLLTLRSGAAKLLATGVARASISDSLVVWHDSVESELNVLWRGRQIPLAQLERTASKPQWSLGGNTVTFFDRGQRTVFLFHQGNLAPMTDSTDVGIVLNGTDIVGYWDAMRDEFMGWHNGKVQRLSGMKPVNAKAGNGILVFVDGTLKLKCWNGKDLQTLTDSTPTSYWVKDRVLLYLTGGRLMVLGPEGPLVVGTTIPEQWAVSGDLLVFLDLNRELWGIRNGERFRISKEAGISSFELHGDAVVYQSPAGPTTVVRKGRRSTY